MYVILLGLAFLSHVFAQPVTLVKPDNTSGVFTPVAHPRVFLDGPTGTLTLALKDPDGAGALKNTRLCADGSQSCPLSAETVWAQAARTYLNNSSSACNGRYDRTGQCAATAALLYWMDNTGTIGGSGADTGKTYIDYVLEALRDIDNRFPLRGVADKAYKFGIPSTGPSVASDYLGMEGWGWAFAYSVARTYSGVGQLSAQDISYFANAMITGASWDSETTGTTCEIRLTPISGSLSTAPGSFVVTGTGTQFTTELAADDLIYLKQSATAAVSVGFYVRVASIQSDTQLTVRAPLTFRYESYTLVNASGFAAAATYDRLFKVPARTPAHCGFLYNVIQHDTVPAVLSAKYRFTAAAIDGVQTTMATSLWFDEINSKYRLSEAPAPPARPQCMDRYPYWVKQDTEIMKVTGASGVCPALTLNVERAQFGTTAASHNSQVVYFGYTNDASWDGWNNQVGTRLDAIVPLSLALMGDDTRASTLFEKAVNYYVQYGVTPAFRKYNTLWGPAWDDYSRSRTDRFLAHILAMLKLGLSPSLDYSGDWLKRLYSTGYIYTFTPWNGRDHARFGNQGGSCMDMQNPACWFGPPFLWAFAPGSSEAKYALYHLLNKGAFTAADLGRINGVEVFFPALLFVPTSETGANYDQLPPALIAKNTDRASSRLYDMAAARSDWSSGAALVLKYGMAQLSDKLIDSQAAAIDIGKGGWLLRNQKSGSYYGYTGITFNRFNLGKQITTSGGVTLAGAEYRGPYILGSDQVRSPDTLPNPGFDRAKQGSNYWYARSPLKTVFDTVFHGFDSANTWAFRWTIHFRNNANDDWVVVLDDVKSALAQKMEQVWHYPQNNESTYTFRPEGKSVMAADASGMTANTTGGQYLHSRWPLGVNYMSDLGVELLSFGSTTTATQVAVGRDCTATAPCRARIGSSVYSWTGSGTAQATIPVSSGLYIWITNAGVLEAATQGGSGLSCTGVVTCTAWPGAIPAGAARIFAFSRAANGSAMAPCTETYTSSAWGSTADQCAGDVIETNTGTLKEGSRHLFLRAGDAVSAARIVTTHQANNSSSADSVSLLSTIDPNWVGVEKAGAFPNVAVFPKDGVERNGTDFTTTHSGTAQYVVAGLNPGTYDTFRNGVAAASGAVVATGEGVLAWSGASGAWEVRFAGALPLGITTTSLPNGQVNAAYSATLTAEGGSGLYSWSVVSGSLPSGLSLTSSTGVISGTPVAVGASSFVVRVNDGAATVDAPLSIDAVSATAPIITTALLPDGVVGTPYSQALGVSGGAAPYTWSIASGSLPAGLSLTAGGLITGIPTAAGSSSFTARVTDGIAQTDTRSLSVTIGATASPLSITTANLPDSFVDVQYSEPIVAAGGNTPYSWSISAGTLCSGLSLDASTGILSGLVTAPQSCTFTVQVTDATNPAQMATKQFTIQFQYAVNRVEAVAWPHQSGALVQYGFRGLLSSQTCSIEVRTIANGILSSKNDTGGLSKRTDLISGLAAGSYKAVVACGAKVAPAEVVFSTTTASGGTVTVPISMTPPAGRNMVNVQVEYGLTTALGSSVSAACATGCTVSLTLNRGQVYYIRDIWKNGTNNTVATSSIRPFVAP